MAHNAGGSLRAGLTDEKLHAVWEYRTSRLFSEAERVAIEFSIAAAAQPNDVTDELFDHMKQHWSEGAIVEIAALVAYFGFMNRWNDTMATPLEDEPAQLAEQHIAQHGWRIGKHAPETGRQDMTGTEPREQT
jgi:alkylhydroperoxidase family enzyme